MKIKKFLPLAFTLYMTLLGGNFILYTAMLPLRVFHHILLTAVLLYWFWKHGLPNTPLLVPVAGMAAAVLLSIPSSVDPRMAFENAWHWFINLGLFVAAIDWCRKGYMKQFLGAQYASGGVLSGSTILQRMVEPIRASGLFFGAVNLTGAYCSALALPIAAHIPSIKSRVQRLTLLVLLGSLLIAMVANESRGPFLSLAVAVVILFIAQYRKRKRILRLAIPILFVLGFIILVFWSQWQHASGDELRLDLWRSAVSMLAQHPLGVGVGLFGQVYRQVGTLTTRPDADGLTGAHNAYLNLGAELGFPGLIAGTVLLLVILMILTRITWNPHKWAVLAALGGIMAQMLVDNYPAQNWSFLVALYTAYLVADARINLSSSKALGWIAGSLLLWYSLPLLAFDRAQFYYERSLSGDMVAALEAAQLDPGLKLYQLQVARLEQGLRGVQNLDSTVRYHTRLGLYALVNWGRPWRDSPIRGQHG
jgi:O-antigen ligase